MYSAGVVAVNSKVVGLASGIGAYTILGRHRTRGNSVESMVI
jgi:hypothetical protein